MGFNALNMMFNGRFPRMVVPLNHPFIDGISLLNHPFWGTFIYGNPHMEIHVWTNKNRFTNGGFKQQTWLFNGRRYGSEGLSERMQQVAETQHDPQKQAIGFLRDQKHPNTHTIHVWYIC